ncbi:MAG: thioredoxin [Aliarcobacter sp.]|jgi:thioredoxin 1|nr:thioredoxin [Aliarcobacter sp.]
MKKIFLIFLISVATLFAYEELNINNFEDKIKDKNVIVDFYAPWCPPCKIVANNFEDFDITKPDNVQVYKVNVDDELALAKKYGVSRLPTIMYFKNGKVVKDYVGVLTSEELLQASKENFKLR